MGKAMAEREGLEREAAEAEQQLQGGETPDEDSVQVRRSPRGGRDREGGKETVRSAGLSWGSECCACARRAVAELR